MLAAPSLCCHVKSLLVLGQCLCMAGALCAIAVLTMLPPLLAALQPDVPNVQPNIADLQPDEPAVQVSLRL
jgi:hypothetical protein